MAELNTNALWRGQSGLVGVPRIQPWPTEFKVLDDEGEEGEFIVQGTATSPAVDFMGDVLPTKALEDDFASYAANPLFTFCHNAERPIGHTFDHKLTGTGLKYKAKIISDPRHDLAQLAQVLIENGVCNQSSIGFSLPDEESFHYEQRDGRKVRVLDRVVLHEIAAVPLAMNPKTSVQIAKALGCEDMHAVTDEEWAEHVEAMAAAQAADEEKKASGATDLPLAEEGTPWRWTSRAQNEILGDDEDWTRYRKCHFQYDPDRADAKAGYKLPFAKVMDGDLKAVWRGVAAAMGALLGARGGVDIPDADRRPVYNRIAGYYKRFDKDVPDFKGTPIGKLVEHEVELPPFSEIEFKAGEKGIIEAARIDESCRFITSRSEGLVNIVSREAGDGVLSDADGGVLSADQLASLKGAHGHIESVLDAHGETVETRMGVLSRADWLDLCRLTASTDPMAAIRARLAR